ncbi:MAG TPA: LytR C-terminal domain-containing protein [Gemmatimonadaceae bacterium]|nr:LytR C-terminal domain-containing protein [Gemmatimonadaceae bacterium]
MTSKENTPLTGPLYRGTPPRRSRRALFAIGGALLMLLGALAALLASRAHVGGETARGDAAPPAPPPPAVRAPEGQRVRVEVLNTTQTRGLARRATQLLRDGGFDVVGVGTVGGGALDSTRVIDRTGHPEWARLVAKALGGATVETRIDSSRYLDVTVLLGGSFRPPTEPLYP